MQRWLRARGTLEIVLLAILVSIVVFVLWVFGIRAVWLSARPGAPVEWDLWGMIEGLSSAAAFAALFGGGIVVLLQLIEASESRHLDVYNSVFERMMRDEEIEARRWIYQNLPENPEHGLQGLSAEDHRKVKLVLNSFDHLGFLLRQQWITDDGLIGWVSPVVVKTWQKLEPYVDHEAERRGEPYYYSAARYLADRCTEWWQANRGEVTFTWLGKDERAL